MQGAFIPNLKDRVFPLEVHKFLSLHQYPPCLKNSKARPQKWGLILEIHFRGRFSFGCRRMISTIFVHLLV